MTQFEQEIAKISPLQSYAQPAQLFWNARGVSRKASFVLVTPKQAGSTPYALERRQLLPHAALLGLIVAGVVLGVMNLVWGVTPFV